MKIAVVDDSKSMVELSISTIESRLKQDDSISVDIKGFTDPVNFIDHVKRNQIDLVLLDQEMPKLNGVGVLNRLVVMNPRIQYIFVVSRNSEALSKVLSKPQVLCILLKNDLYYDNVCNWIKVLSRNRKMTRQNEQLKQLCVFTFIVMTILSAVLFFTEIR